MTANAIENNDLVTDVQAQDPVDMVQEIGRKLDPVCFHRLRRYEKTALRHQHHPGCK